MSNTGELSYILPGQNFNNTQRTVPSEQVFLHGRRALDLRITTFALAMISLFLLGLSYALYGVGTLPPTVLFGLGMFPYLGGVFFSFIAVGLLASAVITGALSGVHTYQKAKWSSVKTD